MRVRASGVLKLAFSKSHIRSNVGLLRHFSNSLASRNDLSQFSANQVFSTNDMQRLPTNLGINFVPQQEAWVVERMGRFLKVLEPGLQFLIPVLDSIKYVQSLKENAIDIPAQKAITSDNVSLDINGVLYVRVIDPYKASYGVEDAGVAITQLAQTTMRSEIGQLTLDNVLKERQSLNHNISNAINQAAEAWGIECLRYEIKDVHPPQNVLQAMHQQVSAERQKRAEILESEGKRQSEINIAEGRKQALISLAEGDARSILVKAEATSKGVEMVAKSLKSETAEKAVQFQIAQQYVQAFSQIAKEGNTIVVPSNIGDAASLVTQALSVYKHVNKT